MLTLPFQVTSSYKSISLGTQGRTVKEPVTTRLPLQSGQEEMNACVLIARLLLLILLSTLTQLRMFCLVNDATSAGCVSHCLLA